MFEDSTFASTNRIRMRNRAGFFVALVFESTLLLAMVVMPLLYPQALPNLVHSILMAAPPAPSPQAKVEPRPANSKTVPTMVSVASIEAPRKIPAGIYQPDKPEGPVSFNPGDLIAENGPGGNNPFGTAAPIVKVVHAPAARAVRLPSSMVEGLLVHKTIPEYPRIAVTTHTEGTVVLQATIARNGAIENLRVMSGPPLLRQAALDAVSTWRYRPYMLNGQPIEVETTVNVVFKLE